MSDRFTTRLRSELPVWVKEGLVSSQQAATLAARYPETTSSRLIGILGLIGGALIAAGVGLVIAHNWERLSDWTKIGGLVALMLGFYAGGFEMRERGLGRAGDAFLMIGGALFLCGIALVAQIFHLNDRPPNAVALWIVALLPIAYLLRSAPVLFLAAGGFLVWLGMESSRPDSWLYAGRSLDGMLAVLLYAPVGVALVALAPLHTRRSIGFDRVLSSLGLLVTGAALYALGFMRHWIAWWSPASEESMMPLRAPLGLAIVAGLLLWAAWRFLPDRPAAARLQHVLLLGLVAVIAVTPGLLERAGISDIGVAESLSLVSWVALLLASIGWISLGVRWDRPAWVNLGLLFVGLNIITRYFDYFGTRLEGGAFFISSGALILVVGVILERQRRRLMRLMAAGAAEVAP